MPVEDADYLGGLDPAFPKSGDPKGQGDNHIRLIKEAARQSFPGFKGAILVGGAATGPADAYVLTPDTPLPGYVDNMMVVFKPSATNITTAPTVKISALPAVPIKSVDGTPLLGGDLVGGQYVAMIYNGATFNLLGVTKNYVNNLQFQSVLPGQPNDGEEYDLTTVGGAASWKRRNIYQNSAHMAQVIALHLAL